MARGWESKSVEDQIASAEERAKAANGPVLSPQQIENRQRIKSLKLSLAYIEQQLAESRSERHRAQLEQAKKDIENQLKQLDVA
ncbi:MAG TPA: hypothetical protein VFC63_19850 [Blastocatellia bacterium]|nr:hypothetical protein [Blastocatellia bacterium]